MSLTLCSRMTDTPYTFAARAMAEMTMLALAVFGQAAVGAAILHEMAMFNRFRL